MKLVIRWGVMALSLNASVAAPNLAQAQPASKARRITNTEFERYEWPTYRQVDHSTPVPQVKVVQFLLRNRSFYKRQPDGVFGAYTAHAVRAFQRANDLKVDGIVGAQTWRPLLLRLKRGDRSDAVRALQTMLRESTGHSLEKMTPDLPVDGIFGAQTEKALRIAQTEKALRIAQEAANWFAGPQIWSIILADGAQP